MRKISRKNSEKPFKNSNNKNHNVEKNNSKSNNRYKITIAIILKIETITPIISKITTIQVSTIELEEGRKMTRRWR
jgi:hypothetical protein